ncbi:hypothetical protein TNCT_734301 [Trichonephila clavata]|uniref:Uncharacterized protein n=1 Tax=Trichonephila clavata TaxID=2740835 RepID=A0A8X6FTD7_TRICU|nr:hypothetical protein TNCT_734301 [Trichonephila clavata]
MFPLEESFFSLSKTYEDRLAKAARLGLVLPRSPVRSPFSPQAEMYNLGLSPQQSVPLKSTPQIRASPNLSPPVASPVI